MIKKVSDSFTLRRFCHLPLENLVRDDKTLIKLAKKFGNEYNGFLGRKLITC